MNYYHSKKNKTRERARRHGYRSGLEEKVKEDLRIRDPKAGYEIIRIRYSIPATEHYYTPDFVLGNGIIIETKGRFTAEDRRKHLLIKSQHPELDIRFLFSNVNKRIRKGSKTSYAEWCDKYNFQYFENCIPDVWIKSKKRRKE